MKFRMAGTTDNPKALMKSLFGETELRKTDVGIMSKQAAHKLEAAQFRGGIRKPTKV